MRVVKDRSLSRWVEVLFPIPLSPLSGVEGSALPLYPFLVAREGGGWGLAPGAVAGLVEGLGGPRTKAYLVAWEEEDEGERVAFLWVREVGGKTLLSYDPYIHKYLAPFLRACARTCLPLL